MIRTEGEKIRAAIDAIDAELELLQQKGLGELERAELQKQDFLDAGESQEAIDRAVKYVLSKRLNRAATPRLEPAPPSPLSGRSPDADSLRFEALSRLVADSVKRERLYCGAEGVTLANFRKKHLRGKLLRAEDVERWIVTGAKREAQPDTPLLGLPHHPEDLARVRRSYTDRWGPLLEFLSRDRSRPVSAIALHRKQTALDDLRELSEALADIVGWQRAAATHWVLTGEPPEIRPIRAWTTGSLYPGMLRVNLDVHPTLTPKEVAAEWSRVRRAILGDRYRNLSEKHLELAIFNATAAAPGESLAARMKRWNREVAARRPVTQRPKWRYKLVTNFGRDLKQAERRVLYPRLRTGSTGKEGEK